MFGSLNFINVIDIFYKLLDKIKQEEQQILAVCRMFVI